MHIGSRSLLPHVGSSWDLRRNSSSGSGRRSERWPQTRVRVGRSSWPATPTSASGAYAWGDYRVLYEIRDRELVVHVVRIGHRRDVYGDR